MNRFARCLCIALLLTGVASAQAWAQATAQISGTVKDTSGAVLPGADITATLPSREEYVSAFMPCTPNPTTGFFFYVLRRDVIELAISVEDAAKLLMSAGMIQPGGGVEQQKKLAAMAETARVSRAVREKAAAE